MARKAVLVVLAVLVAGAVALALYARSALASDAVRRALEAQLAARLDQPVQIGAASASIFPRVALQLRDVTVGSPAIVSLERLSVNTGLRGLFSRRVEHAQILASNGRAVLPQALAFFGALRAAPTRSGGNVEGLTIVSIQVISLRNLQLVAEQSSVQFDMESAVTGDRLDVTMMTARSERTRFQATGAITSISAGEGHFTVAADQLDVDELLGLTSGLTRPAPAGAGPERPADGMRLTLDITAPSGRLAGYGFSDMTAKLTVKPPRVSMDPLSLRTFGGTFDGTLVVVSASPPPALELRGKLAEIDVSRLADTAGSPGSISGRLAGTVSLTSRGGDSTTMVRSARGKAAVAITNGAIPGLEMVRTIVLAFGKPSGAPPPGSGSAFTRLGGDFEIRNGVVRTNQLAMASRDFDMHGPASLSVESGAVDADVEVILSKELTAQAGTDLRRYAQADGRIIIPAHIGGTLSHPAIALDLSAAARRALENELKRRAGSWLDELLKRKKGGS